MTKIYMLRGTLSSLKILEVELIKATPEQLRIDNKTVKVVWEANPHGYEQYLSSRLQRHRTPYFTTLSQALEDAIKSTRSSLEQSVKNTRAAQDQLARLTVALETTPKEPQAEAQKEDSRDV